MLLYICNDLIMNNADTFPNFLCLHDDIRIYCLYLPYTYTNCVIKTIRLPKYVIIIGLSVYNNLRVIRKLIINNNELLL